jgi:hypothetical protein
LARLGSTPPASRYDGIPTGPQFAYLFETQDYSPIDGTNERLRVLSPFTLRFVPPAALVATLDPATRDVNAITSAVGGSNQLLLQQRRDRALNTPSSLGGVSNQNSSRLASFVAQGRGLVQGQGTGFISTLADAYTAADIRLQLEQMVQAEPLTLLVNPNEFAVSYTKIQSFTNRTRQGYVFNAWGENKPEITFRGSTAGFVSGSTGVSPSRGYSEDARRDSAAWQNFISLLHFYKNNGLIYDTVGRSQAHLFVGSVAIEYDQMTYIGNIDSFSYRFDSSMPHRMEFDVAFHVSKMYDNAQSYGTVLPIGGGNTNVGVGVNLGLSQDSRPLSTDNPLLALFPFDLIPG